MKIFMIFGFILVVIIVMIGMVYSQGMYKSATLESNESLDTSSTSMANYEITYSWELLIGFMGILFTIVLVIGLLFT